MSHTIDELFESESFLGDPNDLDNLVEFRDEKDPSLDVEAEEHGGSGNEDEASEAKESSDKKSSEKKIVRIKRPQPKLDAERLRGPRGLLALPKAFSDFQFRGKGYEAEDLSRVLARLEHWAHRLFPKLQIDDFFEKLEKLGTKKAVQAYVKRIRLGMEDSSEVVHQADSDTEEDPNPLNPAPDEPMDEFDRLLNEQVSFYQKNTSIASAPPTPSSMPTPFAPSSSPSSLTAEQKARIEHNRLAAMEKRQKRLVTPLAPVTPPPPPISPLPIDSSTTGSEENTNQGNPTPDRPASEQLPPEGSGSCVDNIADGDSRASSVADSSTVSGAATKMVPDVLSSKKENLVPDSGEPSSSTGHGESAVTDTNLDSSSTEDEEAIARKLSAIEHEIPRSSVQSSKRLSMLCDVESLPPEKKLKKDFPDKDQVDSEDDAEYTPEDAPDSKHLELNFEGNLDKGSPDEMENDEEGCNSGTGNNN